MKYLDREKHGLYYQIIAIYIHLKVLVFYNKLHELNNTKKLMFIFVVLLGLFVILGNGIQRKIPVREDINVIYYVVLYTFIKLFFLKEFAISRNDIILAELSNHKLNAFIGYLILSNIVNVFAPVLISVYIGLVNENIYIMIYSFFVLFLFINSVNALSYVLKLLKLITGKWFMYLYVIVIIICLTVLFNNRNTPFGEVYQILNPLCDILHSAIYHSKITIKYSVFYFLIPFYFLSLMCSSLILHKCSFQLVLEDSKSITRSEKKSFHSSRKYTILTHEAFIIYSLIKDMRNIFYLILPNLICIFLTIYIVSTKNSMVEMSVIDLLFPLWLGLISFPIVYLIPHLRNSLNYLWIYRYSSGSTIQFLNIKLLSFYLLSILSQILSFFIVWLFLFAALGINYIELIDVQLWIRIVLSLSLINVLIGFLLTLSLSNAFYTNEGGLFFMPMLSFVWLMAFLTFPFIYLFIKEYTSASVHAYILYILISCGSALCYCVVRKKILRLEL